MRQEMTGGDGGQTQDDREKDVRQCSAPGARAEQIEGLKAEGGEGGKASADSDHDEEAEVVGDGIPAALQSERSEVSDDEGAKHVDKDGAIWKCDALRECQSRDRVT